MSEQNSSINAILNTGLTQNEIDSIVAVLKSNPAIEKSIIFGSRAKGNYSNGSDVDIAIVGQKLTLNDVLDISIEIDELFLPYKFDIIIYNRITEPDLVDHIDRVGIKLT